MCICPTGTENNEHSFLQCPRHSRRDLLDGISNAADTDFGNLSSTGLCSLLLYGDSPFSLYTNRLLIESTISYKINLMFQVDLANQIVLTFVFCLLFMFSVYFVLKIQDIYFLKLNITSVKKN